MSLWRRLLLAVLLLALAVAAALVWFIGPLVGFGEFRPFESIAVRLGAIFLLLLSAVALCIAVTRGFGSGAVFLAPQPEALPAPPLREHFTDPGAFAEAIQQHRQLCDDRKTYHRELSVTIQRIFYMLLGTCVFCVVTLMGSQDRLLLTTTATVKLPLLNYDIGFQPFLLIGPTLLIGLTVYLHTFIEQHRRYVIPQASRKPMLANLDGWAARSAVVALFYWLVPVTLALFAWKASPQPVGPWLVALTLAATLALAALHFRRTANDPKLIGRKALLLSLATFGFSWAVVEFTWNARQLDLFRVKLAGEDLRNTSFRLANMAQADLSAANLRGADFYRANLSEADFQGADLTRAEFWEADLHDADLRKALLARAGLRHSDLSGADLTGADLAETDLRDANLLQANLAGADLRGARLDETTALLARKGRQKLYNGPFELAPGRADPPAELGPACEQLMGAVNWQSAYRDEALACGAEIPRDE